MIWKIPNVALLHLLGEQSVSFFKGFDLYRTGIESEPSNDVRMMYDNLLIS